MSTQRYRKEYLLTHDIDWFCLIGKTPIHCASNGGMIPDRVNFREQNRRVQDYVSTLPYIVQADELVFNDRYIYARLEATKVDGNEDNANVDRYANYIASFVDMARKGFISFDRDILDLRRERYQWIVKPCRLLEEVVDDIPQFHGNICGAFRHVRNILHVDCLNREK